MNIDLIIVGTFLFVSLILRLRFGRGVTTFKEFAVGDKNFTTQTLTATMVVTYLHGDWISIEIENVYSCGLYFIFPILALFYETYFIGKFLALRMSEFLHHFSIAESMGVLYGKTVRGMTAIIGITSIVVLVAIQMQVIEHMITLSLGFQSNTTLFIAFVVILIYSIFGGIKSVTFTDIFQFATFSTLIPVLIWLAAEHIGKLEDLKMVFETNENFNLSKVLSIQPKSIEMFCLIFICMIPNLHPEIIQRIYMSANVWQAKKVFINTARIAITIGISVIFLSILLLAINGELEPTTFIEYMLNSCSLLGVRGVVCVGFLTLSMSTADSLLNTAAVLFTHDITAVLNWKIQEIKHQLLIARLFIVFIGMLACIIAFQGLSLLTLVLFAACCSFPIQIAFLMAILGFRPSTRVVLISIAVGTLPIILGIILDYSNYASIHSQIFAIFTTIIVSVLTLFGSHYLLPKTPNTGWVGIKDKTPLIQEAQAKKRRQEARKAAIRNFSLITSLERLLPRYRMGYLFLGMYVLVTTFIQLATTSITNSTIYAYIFTMLGGTIALIYPAIKGATVKDSLIVCFGFPIFFFILLFVVGSYTVCRHDYHLVPSIIFMTNIIVGIAFLPWQMALAMPLFAFAMIYCMIPCPAERKLITTSFDGSLFNMGYIIALFSSIGIVVICYKKHHYKLLGKLKYWDQRQAHQQHKELQSGQFKWHFDRLTKNDQDEEDILPSIVQRLGTLMGASNISKKQRAILQDTMNRLDGYKDFIEERTYYEHTHLPLEIASINIIELIHTTIDNFEKEGIHLKLVLHPKIQQHLLACDPVHIEQLLLASMHFIQSSGYIKEDDIVNMYIGETTIKYDLNIAEKGEEKVYRELPAFIFIITTSKDQPIIAPLYEELLDVIVTTTPSDATALYKKRWIKL